ncbi:MAG: hypothetical protein GY696_37200 [Gammaproteobacteria bacterium]|nr:hypothetical protein [Gammaproteobacteria bacterium]
MKRREREKQKKQIKAALAFERDINPEPMLSPLLSLSSVLVASPIVLVAPKASPPEVPPNQVPRTSTTVRAASSEIPGVPSAGVDFAPEISNKMHSSAKANIPVSRSLSELSTTKGVQKKAEPKLMAHSRRRANFISDRRAPSKYSSISACKRNIGNSSAPSATTEASTPNTPTEPGSSVSSSDRQLLSVCKRRRDYPGDRLRSRLEGPHPITDNTNWPWDILPPGLYAEIRLEPKGAAAIDKLEWEQKYVIY